MDLNNAGHARHLVVAALGLAIVMMGGCSSEVAQSGTGEDDTQVDETAVQSGETGRSSTTAQVPDLTSSSAPSMAPDSDSPEIGDDGATRPADLRLDWSTNYSDDSGSLCVAVEDVVEAAWGLSIDYYRNGGELAYVEWIDGSLVATRKCIFEEIPIPGLPRMELVVIMDDVEASSATMKEQGKSYYELTEFFDIAGTSVLVWGQTDSVYPLEIRHLPLDSFHVSMIGLRVMGGGELSPVELVAANNYVVVLGSEFLDQYG